ncbi:MAG TPA: DUF3108 domain-containing protein [Myxococcales bacterium]|nr:DUF3108 domain-containing protein [Myxococcales bacterium]
MAALLALLLASPCPPQRLPRPDFAPETLVYKLDVFGTDVGTFEVRSEPPPDADRPQAAALLSSRAKTNAFASTNLARFETYFTTLVSRDSSPLHYREDIDENDVHHGTELSFPPKNGVLDVQVTRNGEAVPQAPLPADGGVREMISTFFLLRRLSLDQPVCLEVFAGRKVWKLTGRMAARETIDTPLGHLPSLRFDGDAVRLDDAKVSRQAHVWISDDERRLPLVAIGEMKGKTIRAQLIAAPGRRRAQK